MVFLLDADASQPINASVLQDRAENQTWLAYNGIIADNSHPDDIADFMKK
jgi:hypothetical protein